MQGLIAKNCGVKRTIEKHPSLKSIAFFLCKREDFQILFKIKGLSSFLSINVFSSLVYFNIIFVSTLKRQGPFKAKQNAAIIQTTKRGNTCSSDE